MLFWLLVIILVVSILAITLGTWMYNNTKYDTDWLRGVGLLVMTITIICIVFSGLIIIGSYAGIDAKIAQDKEIYKSLTYQLENDLYDNDNDLGKKELYKEIEEWNKNVVYGQNIQDNFWFGIYWPNVYDQFETIEYPVYN